MALVDGVCNDCCHHAAAAAAISCGFEARFSKWEGAGRGGGGNGTGGDAGSPEDLLARFLMRDFLAQRKDILLQLSA